MYTPEPARLRSSLLRRLSSSVSGLTKKHQTIKPGTSSGKLPMFITAISPANLNGSQTEKEEIKDSTTPRFTGHLRTPPSSVKKRDSRSPTQLKSYSQDQICAICEEPLASSLRGEKEILLACNHPCHKICMLVILSLGNRLSSSLPDFLDPSVACCKECGAPARCADANETSQMLEEIAMKGMMSPVEGKIPFTPDGQMIPDPVVHPPVSVRPTSEIYMKKSSAVSPVVDFEDVTTPQITSFADTDTVVLGEIHKKDIEINFKIKAPKTHSVANVAQDHLQKKEVMAEIISKLTNLKNFDQVATNLSTLILFDFLNISVTGSEWDTLCCFLFDDRLLLVDFSKNEIVGQLLIHDDVASINKRENGITLNLTQQGFPELQMCHSHPLICLKWYTYFCRVLALVSTSIVPSVPFNQLTTNGWYVLEDSLSLIPENAIKVRTATEHDCQLTENLLLEALPRPENLPINLVLTIPLVNTSAMDNQTYRTTLMKLVFNVKSRLRAFDKLALIFIGIDASGRACRKGSFIGCAEPKWDGWNAVIEGIEVSNNEDINGAAVFDNEFQELQIAFEKCRDLFPFIPSSPSNINRLLVIHTNRYGHIGCDDDCLESLSRSLASILDSSTLSIDFVSVGDTISPDLQMVHDLVRSPFQGHMLDSVQLRSGSVLQHYSTFENLVTELPHFAQQRYLSVCIPTLTLEFQKIFATNKLVSFKSIDINGTKCDIHDGIAHMNIMLDNLSSDFDYSISLHVELDLHTLDPNVCESITDNLKLAGLFTYKSTWRGERSKTTNYEMKIVLLNEFSFFEDAKSMFSENSLEMLAETKNPYYFDGPLLSAAPLTLDLGFFK